MIDGAAAHDFEVLGEQLALGLRVVERVGETHAVDGVLLDAVHCARRGDADDLVDGRDDVVHVVELRPWCRIGLDFGRPPDGHRVARAAKMRSQQLSPLVRGAAGPGPARVVHVVGLVRAECVKTAKFLERLECCLTVLGIPFCASNSLMVPSWPSAEEPLSPQM